MDGFKTFKYYTAIKLHFTNPKYDVFANRGHVKGSYDKFMSRNDRYLFEKLGRQFDVDKDMIQFIASNFMYGNPDLVYDSNDSQFNYKEFLRRRQSITRIFTDDLDTISNAHATYDFGCNKIPDVLQLYMAKKITLETIVILDSLDDIVTKMRQNSHVALLLGDELHRIEKSRGFVKFDSHKVMAPYDEFISEMKKVQDIPAIA
jgi:hypothetical protein